MMKEAIVAVLIGGAAAYGGYTCARKTTPPFYTVAQGQKVEYNGIVVDGNRVQVPESMIGTNDGINNYAVGANNHAVQFVVNGKLASSKELSDLCTSSANTSTTTTK